MPALFGNGQSSSPSNMPGLRPFPEVLFYDNVRAQHELVTKHLGIKHARAVLGWSMAAGQTYQWATQFPYFMDFAVALELVFGERCAVDQSLGYPFCERGHRQSISS